MTNFKITLAYDGSNYCGWQVQPRGVSIQGEMERAIVKVTRQRVRVTGSGRTDAGVHALGQVGSCEFDTTIPATQLVRALNANLPPAIRVLDVVEAPAGFHAIRDAKGKTYRYRIQQGRVADPFERARTWFIPGMLNVAAMEQAAQYLVGEFDFASFQSAGSPRATTVRHVRRLQVEALAGLLGDVIELEIEANGFLYNMVRNIVGTLVEVGREKYPPEWVMDVREARDRRVAGPTAPPQGLVLVRVAYDSF
jgi:tRNA pseudouridine38-40 synthase